MSTPASPRAQPLLGALLAERYRVVELVAEDAAWALFRADDTQTGARVSIRVLYAGASPTELRASVEREAAVASRITHASIAAGRPAGFTEDGSALLVLPELEAQTIRSVSDGGRVPLSRAAVIAKQLALALEALHGAGVVHRALSPDRVHVVSSSDGERDRVQITGFEFAQLEADERGPALPDGSISALYAAPEVRGGGQVDGRADFYALGQIFYEMVTGSRPTSERTGSMPTMTSIRSVPVAVDALALRLLADDPSRRAAIAMDVVRALDALAEPPLKSAPKAGDERSAAGGAEPTAPRAPGPPRASDAAPATTVAADAYRPTLAGRASASSRASAFYSLPIAARVYTYGVLAIVATLIGAVALRAPVVESDERPPDEPRAVAAPPPEPRPAEAPPKPTSEAPDVARELRAKMEKSLGVGATSAFIADLERLLDVDPAAASDRELRSTIIDVLMRIMIGGGADADKLFELIATKMGSVGPDILFELLTTKGGSRAAKRAEDMLRDAALRSRGTPAMRIAYDLRVTTACDAKVELFERARDDGDRRTLGQLQMLSQDCRRGECCFPNNPALKEAIEALKARAAK